MSPADPPPDSTRWTLVRRAGRQNPAAEAALAELCELYWQPVFRFLRADGRSEETARELTQAFFARLLETGGLDSADPGRGRFRSYLLGAVKHFLQDERTHARRLKRGGGAVHEPLPDESTRAGIHAEVPAIGPVADSHFDREWALHVLERALAALGEEHRLAGKEAIFTVLKPWLTGACAHLTQADAATRIGLSEGTVKVAIHRLRHRFRELIRRDIAQTVDRPEDVDAELRYLVEVLSETAD